MKLLLSYLSLHLKIELEYKASFIMTIIAQVFYILAELITIISFIEKPHYVANSKKYITAILVNIAKLS